MKPLVGIRFVISLAIVTSMMIASISGAAIPVLLKVKKQDPASSSSIILTTVTDIFGFLSLASLLVQWLSQG